RPRRPRAGPAARRRRPAGARAAGPRRPGEASHLAAARGAVPAPLARPDADDRRLGDVAAERAAALRPSAYRGLSAPRGEPRGRPGELLRPGLVSAPLSRRGRT